MLYNKKKNIYNIIILLIIIVFSIIAIDILKNYYPNLTKILNNFKLNSMGSIFSILFSLELFIFFKYLNIKNKYINAISKNCLSIYLIHENLYFRPIIWNKLLNSVLFKTNWLIIIHSIFSILIVYIGCVIISKILDKISFPINFLFNKCLGFTLKIKNVIFNIVKRMKSFEIKI